jgi:integrase
MFTPTAKKGSTKYGPGKRIPTCMLAEYNISEKSMKALVDMGSHSLAKSTWSTYGTAERMLGKCRKEIKKKMELPLTKEDVLEFVGWLASERNVKAGTINSYLAGIRQMHILKGMEPPVIRTNLLKFLLQGQKNKDNIRARAEDNIKRLPMTMTVMRLLKEEIRRWPADINQKLLAWAIATVAFHGAFRIHELLSKTESQFDPDFALLGKDIKLKKMAEGKRILELTLKCPKENKTGKAVVIDIFETEGALCPIKAYSRWLSRYPQESNMPAFRDKAGVPVTGAKMNRWLKELLEKHVNYDKARFTGHSFRIGLATTLGTLGFSNDDVKEAGRWSSNAYEVYMTLPRRRRQAVAQKISQLEKQH